MLVTWDYYINENICQPVDTALKGMNPGISTQRNRFDLDGKVWYIKEKNRQGKYLYEQLKPYLEEYLFEPQHRMCDQYIENDSHPRYWNYQATDFLKKYLLQNVPAVKLFEGRNLVQVVDNWITQEISGFRRIQIHRDLLAQALSDGLQTDWNAIIEHVVPELRYCPADYDKVRLEYYCFLDAIAKIAVNEQVSDTVRREWCNLLVKRWGVLAMIYSVLIGRIINSGHSQMTAIVGQFRSTQREYAALMLAALRHHPDVLPAAKLQKNVTELQSVMRQIKQNRELHELCACIFPSEHWDDYDLATPRMTAAEMVEKISFLERELANTNNRQQDQENLEKYAEFLKEQLGKSISIDELMDAILKCPTPIANLIFTQLDLRLEDICEVWTLHRKELKQKVLLKELEEKNLVTDTFAKVVSIEKAPKVVNHHYAPNSIHEDHSNHLTIQAPNDIETVQVIDNV